MKFTEKERNEALGLLVAKHILRTIAAVKPELSWNRDSVPLPRATAKE